ncbi:MAG: FKBP-type peptidyl-prolyl cis-trans isomerase [Thermoplasmata archaeon]
MSPEAHHGSSARLTEKGDLVRLEYELWTESGGKTELLDTTNEELAQKENARTEGRTWGPRPHEIGGDYFPVGIENSLVGLKAGDEVQREFAPVDAFGERDPNLIELFSMHQIERLPEMRREDAHLDIGTTVTIEGRRGRVVSLTAARVRVDFNPPFAGRKVRGKFKVVEGIAEPAEQARAVVELQYGRSSEFHIEVHEKTITLKVPDRTKFDINWMAAKPRVIDRLRTHLHPQTIRVVEEYATPTPEKKETPEAAKSAEPPAASESPPTAAPEPAPKPKGPKATHSAAKAAPASDDA